MITYKALIADTHEQPWRDALKDFSRFDFVTTPAELLRRLETETFHTAILDVSLPGMSQPALLEWLLDSPHCKRVIVAANADAVSTAVRMVRDGAHEFIAKPLDRHVTQQTISRALEGLVMELDGIQAWRALHCPSLIGDDPKTLQALGMIQRVAASDCDVLITGPSGTGKELVARCIHHASARTQMPFVALNCAAIPRDLMESEIFGHCRGAFTGANEKRVGKFELAHGGSLFLDEMGEMDLALQGKLLRVVQERELTPVGDSRSVRVNVRIISATNQDLLAMCQERLFREDLYYRLNVVPIELAPLAQRPLDIPALVNHFIERANRRHGRHIRLPNRAAMQALLAYGWPGNVRELQNIIERTVVLKVDDSPIRVEDLPAVVVRGNPPKACVDLTASEPGLSLNEALASMEMRLTVDALQRAGGNKARAAQLLGLKRTTLVERLKKLQIDTTELA